MPRARRIVNAKKPDKARTTIKTSAQAGMPKKTWKIAPKINPLDSEVVRAQDLSRDLGNRGVAPVIDRASAQSSQFKLVSCTSVPEIAPAFSDRACAMVAYALVLRGIRSGATNKDFNLWLAYQYLYRSIQKSVNDEQLEGVTFPDFFWELLNAVTPKKPRFKTAQINLTGKFVASTDIGYQNSIQFAYDQVQTDVYLTSLASPTLDTVNKFALLDTVTPGYLEADGAGAAEKLWAFVANGKTLYTLQDYKPILHDDPSAFCTVVPDRGRAWDNVGAIRSTLSSETFIRSPILAKFCFEALVNDFGIGPGPRRGFFQYRPSGGGAAYLGSRASEFMKMDRFHDQLVPLIKHINFTRLFDRFSLLLCRIFEQSLMNQAATPPPAYPLTSQQAAIMLRQMCISFMANDMLFDVDNVEFLTPEGPLVPFAPGADSPRTTTVNMLMPSFFAENIRSLSRLQVPVKKNSNNVIDILPVLAGNQANFLDQQYFSGPEGSTLYQVTPGEIFISLIDGQTTFNNSTRIVCFDGSQLAIITDAHNVWMKAVSSCCTPLVSLGQEKGFAGFMLLSTTVHYKPIIPDPPPPLVQPVTTTTKTLTKAVSHKQLRSVGVGLERNRLRASPVPTNVTLSTLVAVEGYSSTICPAATAWNYAKCMLMPERTLINSPPATESTTEFYRTCMIEPIWIKATSSQESFIIEGSPNWYTEFDRAIEAANLDVKQNLAAPSEWELDYAELCKNGHGGIFGSLATMIGSVIGIPAIGQLAGAVGL